MSENTPDVDIDLPQIHANRESYLNAFVDTFRPRLSALNFPLPPAVKVSCGFPSKGGLSKSRPKLGETWPYEASKDGTLLIFISPLLSEPIQVLAALVYELGRAAVGVDNKDRMRDYMKVVGLRKSRGATDVTEELAEWLEKQLPGLGVYPHSPFCPPEKPDGEKKPGSRMLKVECPNKDCGYIVRASKACVLRGCPTCPCGEVMRGPDFDADGDVVTEAA